MFVRQRCTLYILCFNVLAITAEPLLADGPFRVPPSALSARSISEPRTNGFRIDTHDRESVRSLYNAIYFTGTGIAPSWTGNLDNCEPGETSAEYQDAVLRRLNFYRAMAGVPADIVWNAEYSRKAAHAAAVVSANGVVTHNPDPTLSCYTADGEEAASSSNLALGTAGLDSIEAYFMDAGNNYRVGHRRWLLYPQTREMGNADIDPPDGSSTRRANANWIFDDNFGKTRPAVRDGFVAWPPAGFVPHRLVFPRWSFSYPRANFTNATVTVSTNGVELPVHIENVEIGYGEETIVFVPGTVARDARQTHPRPSADLTYQVTISNVGLAGTTTNFTYTVTVIDAESGSPSVLTGSNSPQIGRTNRYHFPAVDEASAYEFRLGTLAPHRSIEGAEGSSPNVEASISTLYSLVQANIVATGARSFHLAHTTPPRPQSFTLRSWIVPSTRSELRFQSRLGAASTGQVATVLISVDSGSSWRALYQQPGSGGSGESTFSQRAVSLAEFAGRAIMVRFEYGFPFGSFIYSPGAGDQIGWYVDDIQITFAEELTVTESKVVTVPEYSFIPSTERTYYIDARSIFFEQFGGEWIRGKVVAAVPASSTTPTVTISYIQGTGTSWEIAVDTANVSDTTILHIERTDGLTTPWEIIPTTELQVQNSGTQYIYKIPISRVGSGFFRITID